MSDAGRPAPGELEDVPLERLRLRRSAKWRTYPADVLPAFVAEMDFALAAPIREALAEAVALSDTGYPSSGGLGESLARFSAERFAWEVDPDRVRPAPDVMTAVAHLLQGFSEPGGGVVVNPPIYPPFRSVSEAIGRKVVEVPLARVGAGYELDLEALERAFAGGARVYLLCQPHNPSGRSFSREELAGIAALSAHHGVIVISDEIHAALTLPGARHIPYLSLAEAAARGVAITGASKAWNLAGLKCAAIVTASSKMERALNKSLPGFLAYHVGHFGVLASLAAFDAGGPWLDAVLARLDVNRGALAALLAERLPGVVYRPPEAGYLAWLDCRSLGLGDDPAAAFLEHGRVALSSGPTFGEQGRGYARLNFATSPALLAEAVDRLAAGAARAAQAV